MARKIARMAKLQRISRHFFPNFSTLKPHRNLTLECEGLVPSFYLLASHSPINRRSPHAHRQPARPESLPCPMKCSRIWSARTTFRIRRHPSPPGTADPHRGVVPIRMNTNGCCWCRGGHLVFITPDTEVQERVTSLGPGDYINIPAHLQHGVEWTHQPRTTVWLCIYYWGVWWPRRCIVRSEKARP